MPQLIGSVRPSTAFAAIAASTALPPALRISIAACVASGWLVAAMPFLPTAGERVTNVRPAGRSAAITRSAMFIPETAARKATNDTRALMLMDELPKCLATGATMLAWRVAHWASRQVSTTGGRESKPI